MEVKPLLEKDKQLMERRANCMNRVAAYTNVTVPMLLDRLEEGFKQKADGSLYQKDADALREILDGGVLALSQGADGRKGSSAFIRADRYSILLEVKDSYPERYHTDGSGGYTCTYFNKTIYLWNIQSSKKHEFEPLKRYEGMELIAAKHRLQVINNQVSQLNEEASTLKRITGSNR